MELIQIRNPHQGIPELLDRIERIGVIRDSRDGPVIMFPEPTTIVYSHPKERVVFWPERDANPFFHLSEFLWMAASRRDVKFVEQFVKRIRSYSDDGKNFHAAYGFRWRKHFRRDQLPKIISGLTLNKNCRRQVLGIWDVKSDLDRVGFDLPCNISATFQINHEGSLNMVVHNRSNDAIMGALGANIVHFSCLQEYVAAGIGIPVGKYWQVSSNLHVYMRDFEKFKQMAKYSDDAHRLVSLCPYKNELVETTPIIDTDIKTWEEDLHMWMQKPTKTGLRSSFFLRIATPMMMAHKAYKKGDVNQALEIIITQMPEKSDWKRACVEWLERRIQFKRL